MALAMISGIARAPAAEVLDPGEMTARFRSPVANANCQIPTFAVLRLIGQARALIGSDGKPLILIEAEMMQTPAYARFLLAHECCHHTRGHLLRLRRRQRAREPRKVGSPDPQTAMTFLADSISHRKIELDADCCAARLLAHRHDRAGLKAAASAMAALGATGPGAAYPPGLQRAIIIENCGRLQ